MIKQTRKTTILFVFILNKCYLLKVLIKEKMQKIYEFPINGHQKLTKTFKKI